ncbi:MAG: ASKHA domain-containing protein [Coriobacteriales bacterium]|nr:ASKHA domain-containing protein [Coriobacteriales bacterium]
MSDLLKHVKFPEENADLEVEVGKNLLEIIREEGYKIHADCGGIGRCGKCAVMINGKKRFSCLTNVTRDMEVVIPSQESDEGYAIQVDSMDSKKDETVNLQLTEEAHDSDLAIAVDIGTTTVVGKLLSLETGSEIASFAQLNEQLPYGADVVSRINCCLDDSSELSALITKQIDKSIVNLIKDTGVQPEQIKRVVIAGNTTMTYILLNIPCRSLGFVPFTPAHDYPVEQSYNDIFKTGTLDCACTVLPFISAYVGGDLVSGLRSLGEEDDFLLMDMGTNGEMIFKRGDKVICTSTAAGPAFEGGNINCGSGSTRGAISVVDFKDGAWDIQTIGAAEPVSICGSGILDLMAVFVKEGFIDETGMLEEDVIGNDRAVLAKNPALGDSGEVYFNQKDVRQFQLAKSAVRTGVEIIMHEMGGDLPKKVYLAGGFGQNLNPKSALVTGLLPQSFDGRVQAIGNSSLSGAVKLCLNELARVGLEDLAESGNEINLAAHPMFNDQFMDNMSFEVEENE